MSRPASRDSEPVNARLQKLSPRSISAIKRMTKVLIDAGAETSIVDDQRDLTLDHAATFSLSRQLSEIEITERRETVVGTLKGVFPERRQYEFTASEGSTFYRINF